MEKINYIGLLSSITTKSVNDTTYVFSVRKEDSKNLRWGSDQEFITGADYYTATPNKTELKMINAKNNE